MKEPIVERNKEISAIKVKKIAEQIRSNIENGSKIWEVKRRKGQKGKTVQIKYQIKNEE